MALPPITREPAWVAEVVPPNLDRLAKQLRAHYRLAGNAIGAKGNVKHLCGHHRSRRWIQTSGHCTNRSYSVTETPGNRSGGDDDWICALDATLPHAELLAACQRLDAAVRAGRLEKIVAWYGNDDGDQRVDGYNNIANKVASSDSSHLWHLHLSFDRGRANDNHDDLFAILTGGGDNDMDIDGLYGYLSATIEKKTLWPMATQIAALDAKVTLLDAKVKALSIGAIDPAVLGAALLLALSEPGVLDLIAKANADETARRQAA